MGRTSFLILNIFIGVCIQIEIIVLFLSIWLSPKLYYYQDQNLYVYSHSDDFWGNRTILLGQEPSAMNTRIKYSKLEFQIVYYGDRYYCYCPEDTTSLQYEYTHVSKDMSILVEKEYKSLLKEFTSVDDNIKLVTYYHPSKEEWLGHNKHRVWNDSIPLISSKNILYIGANGVPSVYNHLPIELPCIDFPKEGIRQTGNSEDLYENNRLYLISILLILSIFAYLLTLKKMIRLYRS